MSLKKQLRQQAEEIVDNNILHEMIADPRYQPGGPCCPGKQARLKAVRAVYKELLIEAGLREEDK